MPKASGSIKADYKLKDQVFKILTASKTSGDAIPHFANAPVLPIMASLNEKANIWQILAKEEILWQREWKSNTEIETSDLLLALNLFSLRVLPVFFRQLSHTNLERKNRSATNLTNPILAACSSKSEPITLTINVQCIFLWIWPFHLRDFMPCCVSLSLSNSYTCICVF